MARGEVWYTVAVERFLAENMWGWLLLAAWVLPWKGWALWRAARLNDRGWFIALLVIQTLAVLDIVYIFSISKRATLQRAILKP